MSYSNFNTFKLFENVGINSSSDYMLLMKSTGNNVSFHSSNSIDYNNVDIMSIKNIINKKQNEDLNLSSLTGTTINPVITINNNHSDCRIMTNLNVSGNINVLNGGMVKTTGQGSFGSINCGGGIDSHTITSTDTIITGTNNNYSAIWLKNTNCGVRRQANDNEMRLLVGGVYGLTVKKHSATDKRVGINTTDPAYTLDVNGNLRVDYYIYTPTDKDLYIKPGSNFHVQNTTSTNMLTVNGSTRNVGIDNTSPSYRLDVNGTARIGSSTYSSDDRIKIDEELILEATDILLRLRPQKYKKYMGSNLEEVRRHIKNNKKEDYIIESGLIAQEMFYETPELRFLVNNTIDPNIVDETPRNFSDIKNDPDYSNWSDEISSVNYTGLIPYLIQGFKEQQTIINTQQTKINTLETENQQQQTKINELTSIIDKLKTANSFEEFKQTL